MSRLLARIVAAVAFGALASAHAGARWHDPFAPPAQPAVATAEAPPDPTEESEPQLRAILYDKQNAVVNISGRILVPGDTIGGWRLVKVGERSATLVKDGKRIKLTLDKD